MSEWERREIIEAADLVCLNCTRVGEECDGCGVLDVIAAIYEEKA